MVETLLVCLLVFALAITAYFAIGHWKASRTLVPPERATRRWLNREARNSREQEKAG